MRSRSKYHIIFGVVLVCLISIYAGVWGADSYADPSAAVIDRSSMDNLENKTVSGALSHYLMGIIYDNTGNTEGAMEEYREALVYKNDISDIYLKLGADLLLAGDLDNAAVELNKVLELEPESAKSYLLLALIHIAKGDFEKAQEQHMEALKYDPENLKVLTFLSDLLVVQQKLDEAAEVYEKMLQIKKNDPFVSFNLGVIYSKLNRLEDAKQNMKKAIELDENYLEAQMVLGFIYEIEGEETKAIKQYDKVLEIDSLNKEAHVHLGQLYQKMGKVEQAVEQNSILTRLDMSAPEPYLRNFTIYISERNYGKAENVLRKAIRNGISSSVIYASLGYVASLRQNQKEAVEYYGIAVEKEPDNLMYRFYYAVALDLSGKRENAIENLKEIVASENTPPEVYNYLGYIYVEEGKELDKAIELIEKALSMSPKKGAYLDSLGWAYYKKGMYDKALEYTNKAINILPGDPTVREHLGDIYFARGEYEQAARQWGIAYKLDPANKAIREKLNSIKEMEKSKQ